MKRVGLLAGLLVLVLGTGAVAQSPSPDATPLYAPVDLASALPEEVGGIAMSITSMTGPEMLAATSETNRTVVLEVLTSLGKAPTDLASATAIPTDPSPERAYSLIAMRVEGVAADILYDRMWRTFNASWGQPLPDDFVFPHRTIDDRTILDQPAPAGEFAFSYPKGEVLFSVTGYGDATIEDVLAELP